MTQYVAVLSFPQQADAFQAFSELKSSPVATEVQAGAIVKRNTDGTLTIPESSDGSTIGTTTGSLVGMLIGILGGPLGVLLGFGAGALIGSVSDVEKSTRELSAILALSQTIPPERNALVLQTDENDPQALDDFAAHHNASVLRRPLDEVLAELAASAQAAEQARQAADRELREQHRAEHREHRQEAIAKLKEKLHLS